MFLWFAWVISERTINVSIQHRPALVVGAKNESKERNALALTRKPPTQVRSLQLELLGSADSGYTVGHFLAGPNTDPIDYRQTCGSSGHGEGSSQNGDFFGANWRCSHVIVGLNICNA